jgi:transcriptional regulator with XRE-family HTH domain
LKTKSTPIENEGNLPAGERDEQPLLRALLAQAHRRGDTLAKLAKELGVSYERLAQWRRGEGTIAKARASVLEQAARYLGIPVVLVWVMAKEIGPLHFVWPAKASLKERMALEMERLRQDPFLGGFVPSELTTASPAIQLFVIFLYHELDGRGSQVPHAYQWLRTLQLASAGNVEGQSQLDNLRTQEAGRTGVF